MTQKFEDRDRFTLTSKAERYLEYKKSYPQTEKDILIAFSVGFICGLLVAYIIGI